MMTNQFSDNTTNAVPHTLPTFAPKAPVPQQPTTDRRLLLVDDELNVLRSLKRLLRNEGYTIFTANSGAEALEILKNETIHLVVSDQRMPEMTGTELLAQVRRQYPETIRVVLSGYADIDAILGAINVGHIYQFLTKLWQEDTLKATLRECFEHYEGRQYRRRLAQQLQRENASLMGNHQYLLQSLISRLDQANLPDVLSDFPLPVIGVNSNKQIFLASELAELLIPELEDIGESTHILECLPTPILEAYESVLNGRQFDPITVTLETGEIRLHAHAVGAPGNYLLLMDMMD